MEYAILAVVSIIGGGIAGWTSAHNIDGGFNRPLIFHTIDPLFFIFFGFLIPAIVGFMLVGLKGIVISLIVSWLASGTIGGSIREKAKHRRKQ